MTTAKGYAAMEQGGSIQPYTFERRDPGPRDVVIDIDYCGICHSDLHFVNNDWGMSSYPLVPGHEILGRVTSLGSDVTRHAVGDLVAIGCLVDSCRQCPACIAGEEQVCHKGSTPTYGGKERESGRPTYGGYSDGYVVDEHFALRVPTALDPAAAAPLLCAGITTYSPLRHWQVGPDHRVGVVGLGGLGHMGVKLAKAFGAEVTVFTTSPAKAADAHKLGADEVVVTTEKGALKGLAGRLDFVLDTVSAVHDLNGLLGTLRRDGTLCLVGVPPEPSPVSAFPLVGGRRRLTGSAIGGIPETQEMLDFCAANGIGADIEVIDAAGINDAYARMLRNDVKYRFVIDLNASA